MKHHWPQAILLAWLGFALIWRASRASWARMPELVLLAAILWAGGFFDG